MRTRQWWKAGGHALLVATVVTLAGSTVAAAAVDPIGPPPAPSAPPGTWIVTLTPGADARAEAPGLAQQHGGQVVAVYTHVFEGFAFSGSAAAADALAHNPHVTHVEESRTLHAVEIAPNGILRTSAWAAHQAGYTGTTTGGKPVRVAVVDTEVVT